MGRLTAKERKALDELFTAMHEKRNFLEKIRNSRKDMMKIFKFLIKTEKTITKHY